ncbi:MAG: hypothetical protein ACE10D_12120 [Planctomycetota bacterium]
MGESGADGTGEQESGEATPVCTRCAVPVPAGEDLCPKCGAPVGIAATMLPIEGLFRKRSKTSGPPNLLWAFVLLLVIALALLLNR